MLMFTYGTLKDPLRLEQDGAIVTVENAVVQGFKMYSNKGFFPITKGQEIRMTSSTVHYSSFRSTLSHNITTGSRATFQDVIQS